MVAIMADIRAGGLVGDFISQLELGRVRVMGRVRVRIGLVWGLG